MIHDGFFLIKHQYCMYYDTWKVWKMAVDTIKRRFLYMLRTQRQCCSRGFLTKVIIVHSIALKMCSSLMMPILLCTASLFSDRWYFHKLFNVQSLGFESFFKILELLSHLCLSLFLVSHSLAEVVHHLRST